MGFPPAPPAGVLRRVLVYLPGEAGPGKALTQKFEEAFSGRAAPFLGV